MKKAGLPRSPIVSLDTKQALADVGVDALEFLVVDDGSSDDTVTIMQRIMDQASNVRLISSFSESEGMALR